MKRPEQELHRAAYNYIRYAAPSILCFHVPNGGKRSVIEAAIFKSMGVLPGVADLILSWKDGKGAIEFKAGNGKQTDHQIAFHKKWVDLGGKYALCRSLDEVQDALKRWGVI
jgi:hypothetical protein